MQRIAGVLAKNGYDVKLVGRRRKHSIPLDKMPFEQHRISCLFEKGKLFYLEYNLRLFWYLLFSNATVYAAVDLDTLLPCTLVAKLKGKKLVFDAHEYFTEVPEVTERPAIKAIWQGVANICIPRVDKAYTVGNELANLFSKQYGIQFETILNTPEYIKRDIEIKGANEIPIIIYQGALNEGRGLPQLIRAMQQVDAKLLIAGEGDLSVSLRLLVAELKLETKVNFTGFIKPKDLSAFTNKATIASNLLEPKGLSYQYSLANKFFDYMHAGIPQICADFIEYRQINQNYNIAMLCNCEENEIARNLNKLLSDKHLYQQMEQNCALAAQVYNLQREEKKLLNIYKQLFT